jgi:hypothetical protein
VSETPETPPGPGPVAGLLLLVGLTLAANPLYWDRLRAVGVASAVDPLGAVGLVPPGVYHAGVGAAYAACGAALGVGWTDHGRLLGVAVAALFPVSLATFGAYAVAVGGVNPTTSALALGVGAVAAGLPAGTAPTDEDRLRVLVGAGLLLVPFLGWTAVNAGSPASLPTAVTLGAVPLLAVLDVLAAYPLYRVGRAVAAE